MEPAETERAITAATSIAASLGLAAEQAVVLQDSNKVTVRLLPADVVARIAPAGTHGASFEVALATRLHAAGGPIATLDPRVEARGHVRDGFEVTFWTFLAPRPSPIPPDRYARSLEHLHRAMRTIEGEVTTPRFTDRVAEAEQVISSPGRSPELGRPDRDLLATVLDRSTAAILHRARPEPLLHGEPHPGNVLATTDGPRFIDLETCCRGPVEFDIAHAPASVADRYPGLDGEVLAECRALVLAMVAAWRFDRDDRLPGGERFGRALVSALRAGPPWPTVGEVFDRSATAADD